MSEIDDIFEAAIPTITKVIPEHTITERKQPICFVVSKELFLKLNEEAYHDNSKEYGKLAAYSTRLEYNGIPVYSEDEVVIIK